ncbi:MAG: ABC transporter ATP-binding protein [Clostridia bacterium]|nr:ABC transporter ATP-binding protein [Clostridia bacterium]
MFSLICAQGLTKRYGDKLALDGACFAIEEGQVVGLLGLNGAGKSTTMNILTGCISATAGTVAIGGYDIATHPRQAKRITGYLPEQPAFYPEMKVRDHLNFVCGLKGLPAVGRKKHIDHICGLVGLEDMLGRMVRNLSKGYRQRLGFAQALVGDPKVIILDEPTVGLDPSQIIEIRRLIKDSGQRATVIVSSHILSEIQAVCDRVIMLQKGRVIADCPTNEMVGRASIRVRVQGEAEVIGAALHKVPGMGSVKQLGQNEPGTWDFALESAGGSDIRPAVFRALAAADLPLLAAHSADISLEEAFLHLTGGAT